MVKFKNKWTGADMWVADDRVEEYKAAGHKLAVSVVKAEPPKPQKTTRKRTTKK